MFERIIVQPKKLDVSDTEDEGTLKFWNIETYPGADKFLARPGKKQAQKHIRDACDFNNIKTWAVIKFFFFLQGKALEEIHAILTETLACFLTGRAKDLSAPLYYLMVLCCIPLRLKHQEGCYENIKSCIDFW